MNSKIFCSSVLIVTFHGHAADESASCPCLFILPGSISCSLRQTQNV